MRRRKNGIQGKEVPQEEKKSRRISSTSAIGSAAVQLNFDVVSLADWDDGDGARPVEAGIRDRLLGGVAAAAADDENPDDAAVNSNDSDAEPPRIAYLLEGTKGDGLRMRRTLQAIYHPRNQYILHLDLEAPPRERIDLAMYVKGDPMFSQVGNVRVIAKGNLVTYKGPTMVACTPWPSSSRRGSTGTGSSISAPRITRS